MNALGKENWVGVSCGVAYGAFCRFIFGMKGLKSAGYETRDLFYAMSYSFIFVVPLVIGILTILLAPADSKSKTKWWYWIFMPWLSCGLMMLIAALLAWEGAICIAFGAPAILVLGSIGGLVAGLLSKRQKKTNGFVLASFLILPFLTAPLEQAGGPPSDRFNTVSTAVAIDASPEMVWKQIVRVPEIHAEERKTSFFHAIGIPKPIEATLSHEGRGGVREARFEKGIVFHENIDEWEPNRSLGFAIHVDPSSIPPDALDEHVRVGDRYFDVLSGRFQIDPNPAGGVLLRLSSRHRITTPFNWYSSFWSERVMQDIQETICRVIKNRSEAL